MDGKRALVGRVLAACQGVAILAWALLGPAGVGLGAYRIWDVIHLRQVGVRAHAVVLSTSSDTQDDGTDYFAKVRYPVGAVEHTAQVTGDQGMRAGDSVKIVYDPARPDHAKATSDLHIWSLIGPGVLITTGLRWTYGLLADVRSCTAATWKLRRKSGARRGGQPGVGTCLR